MKKIVTILAASLPVAILPGVAEAHLGHLGELAGHSHWIGLVLGLAGAAGAAAIALLPRDEEDGEEDAEEAAEAGEAVEDGGEGQLA